MAQLFLIRHGQTDWNREGRYTGQSDIPLNENGHREARELVEYFHLTPPTAVYCSDLLRARQTAATLEEAFDLEATPDPRLREIHQGEWEGLHVSEIQTRYAKQFAARKADPFAIHPPGGESITSVQERVLSALADIRSNHGGEKDRIAIVCHGFVIALIRIYFSGEPITSVWQHVPKNAEIICQNV